MDLFVIDTSGNNNLLSKEGDSDTVIQYETGFELNASSTTTPSSLDAPQSTSRLVELLKEESQIEIHDDDADYGELGPPTENTSKIIARCLEFQRKKEMPSKKHIKLELFAESVVWKSFLNRKQQLLNNPQMYGNGPTDFKDLLATNIKKELESSKIKNLEKKSTNMAKLNEKQLKKLRKEERSKTKGSNWYNLPATEVTEEVENDLKILQMRSALNPKHFYKKNDLKVLPKYFQIGTVLHSPLDYYNERHIRKNKKKSIVDELMADAEFNQYTKRKYRQIMDKKQNQSGYNKALKKMKKSKKKN